MASGTPVEEEQRGGAGSVWLQMLLVVVSLLPDADALIFLRLLKPPCANDLLIPACRFVLLPDAFFTSPSHRKPSLLVVFPLAAPDWDR